MRDSEETCGTVVIVIILMLMSFLGGFSCSASHQRSRAIYAGAGYWTVDEKTGNTEFIYGPKKEKEKVEESKGKE